MSEKLPNTTIVIFGITGDLARKKLLPSLYNLFREGLLPEETIIFGISRKKFYAEELKEFIPEASRNGEQWVEFVKRIRHIGGDASTAETYVRLGEALKVARGTAHCQSTLHYLAVAPALYTVIAKHLHTSKLSKICGAHKSFSRVIIEKPFGKDLASARELNRILRKCFAEEQIYRIDHYMGKETVQNLLTFRFANDIFSPLWNAAGIDHVQITAAESHGIENRGNYYDQTGALRDMVQNHLLQLLAHITMAEPNNFTGDAVRKERIKVLGALRPLKASEVKRFVVRGQYAAGTVEGKTAAGYLQESQVSQNSQTETFVALKTHFTRPEWRGVPFYIRTGKRMAQKYTEIAIQFKERSRHLFHGFPGDEPNMLYFRIFPDESITIRFTVKQPGFTQKVRSVETTLCYENAFKMRLYEAYERLILDALSGDQMLFAHTKEVEAQWKFVSSILDAWEREARPVIYEYPAGTDGPKAADELIERDGRKWMPYKPGICNPFQS